MRNLSKSKILAYRQCPKRLWLEIHKPELRDDSGSEAAFAIGFQVGDVARKVHDPDGRGVTVDIEGLGHGPALALSAALLAEGTGPVFEAGVTIPGALAYADVMLPDRSEGALRWRMIEVKASTAVKDYQRDDLAVQVFIATSAGVPLASAGVAHIDNSFVYPGGGDYSGIFREVDLTEECLARAGEVKGWIEGAAETAERDDEPARAVGPHCGSPFACPFGAYCTGPQPGTEPAVYPVSCLPRLFGWRRAAIEEAGIADLREVPDDWLTDIQRRVRDCSVTGTPYFDAEGAAADLAGYGFPCYFLDFETIGFAVPVWKGTRPYQQIPFQFSVHRLGEDGNLDHMPFLDLTGDDPSPSVAADLMAACGVRGPVFVYNARFERRILRELAQRVPGRAEALLAIEARIVDLEPIARRRYYHPCQHGSWSLKAVLPALCPDLSYGDLDGVRDGGMAQMAYQEAVSPSATPEDKHRLARQLLAYCHLDTLALVRMREVFAGKDRRQLQILR
ncbi:MAG: DUF2779 domain-containing protein [Verrucomicrobia bacterium]|nr:DUF2779 domain-containing protein [Verrucomicrobiota bacterium]